MAERVSNSDENQMDLSKNVQSSNLNEFRVTKKMFFKLFNKILIYFSKEMVDVALNLDISAQSNNDSKLFSLR
jgi:hypothetical protein